MSEAVSVSEVLSAVLSHKFSTTIGNQKKSVRMGALNGCIFTSTDPKGLTKPIILYLPDWTPEIHHGEISDEIELKGGFHSDFSSLKIESKNKELIEQWYQTIVETNVLVQRVRVGTGKHSFKLGVQTEFLRVKCYFQMDKIVFKQSKSSRSETSTQPTMNDQECPRAPGIHAVFPLNEPKHIHIYQGGNILYKIHCKNEEQARRIIISLNSLPPEVKEKSSVNFGDIPEIEENKSLIRNYKTIVDISMQLLSVILPDAVPSEVNIEISDNLEDDIKTETDPATFIKRMETKLDSLEEILFDESHVTANDVIEDICNSYSDCIVKKNPYPQANLSRYQNLPVGFMLPFDSTTHIYNSTEIDFQPTDEYFLNSPLVLSYSQTLSQLRAKLGVIAKPPDFIVNENPQNIYDEVIQTLKKDVVTPEICTGIMLQGCKCTIGQLYIKLQKTHFSILDIRETLNQKPFNDQEGMIYFFKVLQSKQLIALFFQSLEIMDSFKRSTYYTDALMRVPNFSKLLSDLLLKIPPKDPTPVPLASSKDGKAQNDNIPYSLPFVHLYAPHVRLANHISLLKANLARYWVVVPNEKPSSTPLSETLAIIMNLSLNGAKPPLDGTVSNLEHGLKSFSGNIQGLFREVSQLVNDKTQRIIGAHILSICEGNCAELMLSLMHFFHSPVERNTLAIYIIPYIKQLQEIITSKIVVQKESLIVSITPSVVQALSRIN